MFPEDSRFFERSKLIAARFLQTVLVIDDEAYLGKEATPESIDRNITSTDTDNQPRRRGHDTTKLTAPRSDLDDEQHPLDAQAVINSFARKKIMCSIIRPADGHPARELIEHLASNADIVILDWKLSDNEEEGIQALKIIEDISRGAVDTPAQLRLLAIYTGNPDIHSIAKEIQKVLNKQLKGHVKQEDNEFTLSYNSVRIAIYAKSYTNIPEHYVDRKVSFSELADKVITEFTIMTAGLVSNVAIEALSCVRQNTFGILKRFAQELDAPLLTHRFLQSEPEDTESHLVTLISEEIRAILEEARIGSEAGVASISEWLDAKGLEAIEPYDGKKLVKADLLQLAEKGITSLSNDRLNTGNKKNLHKHLTRSLSLTSVDGGLDDKFAVLTNLRSFYDNTSRILTLGTIIKTPVSKQGEGNNVHYYLCLQPVCDTVRISEKRAFPFIPLDVVNRDQDEFSIVVCEQIDGSDHLIRLLPRTRPYDLKLIEFAPQNDGDDRIICSQSEDVYILRDIDKVDYKWVGELRSEQGMRIITNFADTLSRVGLNESEWLRRSGHS